MDVYSLTEMTGGGCFGVFSSQEKATAAAISYTKEWGYDENDIEETTWDGWSKRVYYGGGGEAGGSFEIWRHTLDG